MKIHRVFMAVLLIAGISIFPISTHGEATQVIPMSLEVTYEPSSPRVGEDVHITLRVQDLDGSVQRVEISFGEGQGGYVTSWLCAVPVPTIDYVDPYIHRYSTAGTFDIEATVTTNLCRPVLTEEKTVQIPITILP